MAKRHPIFLVGEIVTKITPGHIPHGAEVEIIGPLMVRDLEAEGVPNFTGPRVQRCYIVSWEGQPDIDFYVGPEKLRKLDPPGDPLTLVQWSDCPWQPRTSAADNLRGNGHD